MTGDIYTAGGVGLFGVVWGESEMFSHERAQRTQRIFAGKGVEHFLLRRIFDLLDAACAFEAGGLG